MQTTAEHWKCFLFALLILQGLVTKAQSDKNLTLNGQWKLYYGQFMENAPANPGELQKSNWPSVPATVPGNVEIDLLAAGKIKNPELDKNIYDLRGYEPYCWWYCREFKTPQYKKGERVEIVFEGLDCLGTIWINNQLVGTAENMFIEHRFDITDIMKPDGTNSIFVKIEPVVEIGQEYLVGAVGSRGDFRPEGMNIRKAPHMFGWDIMPRLMSAGLWRDVNLEIKKTTRVEQVYWQTNQVDVENKTAEVLVDFQIYSDYATIDGLNMEVSLNRKGKNVFKKSYPLYTYCKRYSIDLENVDFWWPRGYGDAALYDAQLRLMDDKGNVLDENSQRVGIRTAQLVRTDITTKEEPGEFVFKINGEKIFVRGTNWVPLDGLHSRDKTHLQEAINMAVDLNCNMLRCWGGNVYEDNDFFDLCDENGIMVWQDFAMGCTTYPQSPDFQNKIRQEAISIILKLRKHPSLVLWAGNNENDNSLEWMYKKPIDPGMDVISRKVLPHVVWEFDPLRDYLPSSPYYSEQYFKNGKNPKQLPEAHLWGPRGYYKATFYTDIDNHFVSEIGYHGCPNRESIEKMFSPEYQYPWTKEGVWNQTWKTKAVRPHPDLTKYDFRNDLMIKQINAVFGECPKDLDQFIFASQSVQAEAMKFFVELWRMDKFRKTGIIWWNLRDGWPIISDAIVDYYNSKKLAYYYIKQAQHDACVMIGDAKEGKHAVIAVNDTRETKSGTVTVRDADSGASLFSASFEIPVNGKSTVGYIPEMEGQAMWLIEYTIGQEKFTNHYLSGKAPFKLNDYQRWYKKLGIKRV